MSNAIQFLLDAMCRARIKALSGDERYVRLEEERASAWESFRSRHPQEVQQAALDVVNAEVLLCDLETEYSFLMGLKMGMEIGRLDLPPGD